MPHGNIRNRTDFRHLVQQIVLMKMLWTVVVIMLLQQIKTTDAAKFKGDSCVSKSQPGICKEWDECPIIKTLIDSGEYTILEVVRCGFGIRKELICCPVIRTDPKTNDPTNVENKHGAAEPTITTTQVPVRDFWLDLLENTTTSTTAVPDFWLDLLSTTTTTTTTIKPLIVGEQRLNESSDFFDFNALLGGKQNGVNKQENHINPEITTLNNNNNDNPANQVFNAANGNGQGGLPTGPVNINQWHFDQSGNNFNSLSARDNNGHNGFLHGNGNGNAWGRKNNGRNPTNEQQNFNRGSIMGRGPPNNPGRGNNNGRGAHNDGRFRNSFGVGNQNHGFTFPENNMRPNNYIVGDDTPNRRPGRPVNNIQDQNPNNLNLNSSPSNSNTHIDNNSDKNIDDLIKNVFETSTKDYVHAEERSEKPNDITLDESIANIFNINKPQDASFNQGNPPAPKMNIPQPVVWFSTQENHNNHELEYAGVQIQQQQQQQQIGMINPQVQGQFEIIPAVEQQINGNDLDLAPSTSFIQQPVVIETWPNNFVHKPVFNPVQVVYENLVNSGMNIVKAEDDQFFKQQQQHQQPAQVFVTQLQPQPQSQTQHDLSYQFINQQPQISETFGQHFSNKLVQQPQQMESSGKEPRSTSPLQQFVPQANSGSVINVQSPPLNVLDPFKPFEFREPPEDKSNHLEDNHLLSNTPSSTSTTMKPDTQTNRDRPAVRACRRIVGGLNASLSIHIIGGTSAELGEFPHMAAIGYSRIGGDDRPPYDIRCGGTLIDKRFVLTAAHCVSERENVPSIVRLGVVNFTDAEQMSAAVEVRIKETYIHDDYSTRLTYNDIAILELEREVEFSEYIYPVCLYTNETDPDTKIKLWVTGWGTINTTTRSFSDILLKAPLHTSPLTHCNKSFTDYGLNRRIPEGIIRTQFCAEDKDQTKDACQGDSGGPLNMIVDESYKNYQLVGVVSSGFGCASSTPGLYTRVAAFLDFIEKIVWPNGGD